MSMTANRASRADARCNAARVLAAADLVYARCGADLQMSEVAAHAGVGVATLYRNFPSKNALLGALAEERFSACMHAADEALADEDAYAAFVGFFLRIGHLLESDAGLRSIIAGLPAKDRPCQTGELTSRVSALRERAVVAGVIPAETTVADLQALVGALSGAIRTTVSSERAVQLVLGGILGSPKHPQRALRTLRPP